MGMQVYMHNTRETQEKNFAKNIEKKILKSLNHTVVLQILPTNFMIKIRGQQRGACVTLCCAPFHNCHMLIPASLGTATAILDDSYGADTFSFLVITRLV